MKVNKALSAKIGSKGITKAAGPRRPLRKPPGKPLSSSSPSKPAGNKPAQSPRSTKTTKPTGK